MPQGTNILPAKIILHTDMKSRQLLNLQGKSHGIKGSGYFKKPGLALSRSLGENSFTAFKFVYDYTLAKAIKCSYLLPDVSSREPFHQGAQDQRSQPSSRTYFQHHRFFFFFVDGDICAVNPGISTQVSEPDIGVSEGEKKRI